MQHLIEWVLEIDFQELTMTEIMEKFDSLLDKEKEQIIDAWVDGVEEEPLSRILGNAYYNKTYRKPFNHNLN